VPLLLPPFPVDVLLPFFQVFESPVVLTGSPVGQFVPPIELFLSLVVLLFLSMWVI